jgi:hypothetical protein
VKQVLETSFNEFTVSILELASIGVMQEKHGYIYFNIFLPWLNVLLQCKTQQKQT